MKKGSSRLFWTLPFVFGAIVMFYVLFQVQKCEPGVWVPHLNLCADFAAEGEEGYELVQTEICGEDGVCRYQFSGVDGKVLDLPEEISMFLTPLGMPHSFSPELEHLAYVENKGSLAVLHVYDLQAQRDYTVQGFGQKNKGLSGFEWDGEERFNFVAIELSASEEYKITRFTHALDDEKWTLGREELLEGEVECGPIYCEVK